MDIFDNPILCRKCDSKMQKAKFVKRGFLLRAMVCPRCSEKIVHPVDEQEYRKIKQEALIKRESMRRNKFQTQRDGCWYLLSKEFGMTQQDIAKRMEQLTGIFVAQAVISDGIRHYLSEQEVLSTQRT